MSIHSHNFKHLKHVCQVERGIPRGADRRLCPLSALVFAPDTIIELYLGRPDYLVIAADEIDPKAPLSNCDLASIHFRGDNSKETEPAQIFGDNERIVGWLLSTRNTQEIVSHLFLCLWGHLTKVVHRDSCNFRGSLAGCDGSSIGVAPRYVLPCVWVWMPGRHLGDISLFRILCYLIEDLLVLVCAAESLVGGVC